MAIADKELYKLKVQVSVLKEVLEGYPTATISNAISQIQSRIKEIEKQTKE